MHVKEKKPKKNVAAPSSIEKDAVVFITAYDIHKFEHHYLRFKRKSKIKDLFSQFHIAGISHSDMYVTPYAKCRYTVEYDSLNQVSAFHFDKSFAQYDKANKNFTDEMMATLHLRHSAKALLDETLIKLNTCFCMDRFLVIIADKVYQVDPMAFIMSGTLMVCFELIDFKTGVPLEATSIFGRANNFGILPITKLRYFDEPEFKADNRKISDVIFENVYGFLTRASGNKWEIGNYSYVHNTIVISNSINQISDYFQRVLGGKIEDFSVDNLSATDAFKYYSTEYLGVVTDIVSNEDRPRIMNDCIMLECFKVFVLLKMILDYEIHQKIDEIVDHQIYARSQLHPLHVPIVTLNLIDNLKKTYSFIRYEKAIEFKMEALRIYQERKNNKNGRLLNILLYILAMLGSAQTLQVLKTEFGLPFNISFWFTMAIFVVFGVVWLIRENKRG